MIKGGGDGEAGKRKKKGGKRALKSVIWKDKKHSNGEKISYMLIRKLIK